MSQSTSTDFTPSPYQQRIYDFVEKGTGNAVIDAVAGSGKTTTIVKALSFIPTTQKVIFVAFNKSIVNELSSRVPSHVEVKTMHSFGFGACRYHMGNVMVKDDKVMEIIKQLYPTWNIDESVSEGYAHRVRSIVDLAKLNLASSVEELYEIVEHHGIETLNSEVEKAWIVYGIARNFGKMIDMTDMIFLPAYNKWKVKQYDWVLVDECQDLNKCQQELLKMMIKPRTGRFIAVGDPRQAIYGFAGADARSFESLKSIPNTICLPLSVNYRCPNSVIELTKPLVPHLEAHDNAIEGEVDFEGKWKNIQDGDYVLCRTVRPLVKLCIDLLVEGKKATVRGRDIGANLITMLQRTKKSRFPDAIDQLYLDAERSIQKSIKRGQNEAEVRNSVATQSMSDKIQAIEIIGGSLDKTQDVITKIESLFSDDKKGIVLSTIHKAKGLEANNVFILCPELMPFPYAKKDWEREQEMNLIYVAYTRAKRKLSFIDDYDTKK
jgi:DNA helicase-2/ATP-dependent DNA helicase PcrA